MARTERHMAPPRSFCPKTAEVFEKEGDSKFGLQMSAQEYENKGLISRERDCVTGLGWSALRLCEREVPERCCFDVNTSEFTIKSL